jgi:hypothetical protein
MASRGAPAEFLAQRVFSGRRVKELIGAAASATLEAERASKVWAGLADEYQLQMHLENKEDAKAVLSSITHCNDDTSLRAMQ